jgi:hypothetical protein
MDLDAIIERAGGTEVLSSEDEIGAAFAARDALRELGGEGRIRVLSWVAAALGIPVSAGSAPARPQEEVPGDS